MSAIQARIQAFESLQNAPQQGAGRKPPVKLYETDNDEASPNASTLKHEAASAAATRHDEKELEDDAHELSVGSITSDFVKVTPPRSRPPPLPPRKGSDNSSSNPGTPSIEENGTSRSNSPKASLPRGPPTPRPIPQKAKVVGTIPRNADISSSTLTVNPRNSRGHMHAPSASSFHSVSLSEHGDTDREAEEHGLGGSYEAVSPHSSSVFSLVDRSNSITSSPATSVSNLAPPALPPRPSSVSPHPPSSLASNAFDAMSHQINVPYAVRKAPPPPIQTTTGYGRGGRDHRPTTTDEVPQRNSARSSLASVTTVNTPSTMSLLSSNGKAISRGTSSANHSSFGQSLAKRKPPPLPPTARARYDILFDANIKAQRERRVRATKTLRPSSVSRRAVGWRGTSMDITPDTASIDQALINMDDPEKDNHEEDSEPRLSGRVVRLIWSCSKLPKGSLKAIWDECDSSKRGSLDKQAFAQGMWRIDNELLSAASSRTPSASAFRTPPRQSETRR